MENRIISVVIPVKNGIATLERCLKGLRSQTLWQSLDIIILDSMSTDGSREVANKYNAIIIDIPRGTFNHGLTRNIAVQYAKGQLVYYTVQDAWIEDEQMLEKMSRHFEDIEMQAVVGHQAIPPGHLDKNPAYWFKRYTEPEVEIRFFESGLSFNALPQKGQFALSSWDNVIAMYRKSALQQIAFRSTNFSEDWLWANDALKKGMKIARDPSLVTYHYHHHTFGYTLRSQFIINFHFFIYFQHLPPLTLSPMKFVRAVYSIVKKKQLSTSKKIYWVQHNLFMNLAAFFSALLFRTVVIIGGKRLLNSAYKIVCREVPQGMQNGRLFGKINENFHC